MPFIENLTVCLAITIIEHTLYHGILTTSWTVTHLHFIAEETASLKVLIRWYDHPTVYLVSKPVLQTMILHLRENTVKERRRKKKDPMLDFQKSGRKQNTVSGTRVHLHFISYPRRKRDGCVVLWGSLGGIQAVLPRGS